MDTGSLLNENKQKSTELDDAWPGGGALRSSLIISDYRLL